MLENFRFFGAPHVAFVTSPAALGAYGILDCGAFITGFMLAAQALGLASIAQAVPEDRHILCGISFGYGNTAHPATSFRTARAAVGEVMEWR